MDPNNHQPAVPTSSATIVRCDECGAPVDEEQRYCVECGAHRRHVADPVARYLSQASARSRTTRAAATAGRTPRAAAGRSRGLGVALALALIPAAAAVGVLAGRSSNNDNSALINALAREQTAASHLAASAGSAASTATASVSHGAGSTSSTHSTGAKGSGSKSKSASHTRHRASKSTKSSKSTKATSGGSTAISTAPPTAAQKQTGLQATQKVQKSKGKSYVHQQSSLPGTVVVP